MIVTKLRERCDEAAPTEISKFWQLPEREVRFETTTPKWIPIMCAKPISSNREEQCRTEVTSLDTATVSREIPNTYLSEHV
jgi:hypothetical protein